ncbi:MAG TPA: hypothetical protein VMF52_21675 [Steroidobacteraceae bacterium]|nr:hypothetical protein [Steroidobacteraceae bacterium]
MNRKTLIAVAVATLIPLGAGTVMAGDKHDKMKAGASFDALDTNRDGRISRAEASADSRIVFAQADANGDGYLDNMEYSKASKAASSDNSSMPTPQSQSSAPDDTTGTAPVTPEEPTTTPPSDTETPRQ